MRAVVASHEGDAVGFGMTRKVTAAHGAGLAVAHAVVPPGAFVPPHVHTREDEATHVLAGELHVVVGDEHAVVGAGGWVLKPRHVFHSFWNAGPAPAHVIEVVTPATLDGYFEELFRIATAPGLDDTARAAAVTAHHARHGITFDAERERALRVRFAAVLP